jgi:hypothetical protein
VRTLDLEILQPHTRRVLVEPNFDPRDRDAEIVQAPQLGLVLGGDGGCDAGRSSDGVGRRGFHGFVASVAIGGVGGAQGDERWERSGCAREREGGDCVGAELIFEDEEEAVEARGGVGCAVWVRGFEAVREDVVGLEVIRVGVGMGVGVLLGGSCRELAFARGGGRQGRSRRDLRFTAAGELSTVHNAARTASAIPSLITLPSHSTSTRPPGRQRTLTQSMTTYFMLDLLTSSSASSLTPLPFPFTSLPLTAASVISSSFIAPNAPSRTHRIRSTPAADSLMCCRHTIVVVVKPAYSFKSSGAMKESLKSVSCWISTPLIRLGCSSVSLFSSPSALRRGPGGEMDASLPTTLAILSVLKGMRTSSQLAGDRILTGSFRCALKPRSLDFKRFILPFSPWTRI